MKIVSKYLGIATTALALTALGAAQETQNTNQLVAANAELVHNLDAKTAKQGDTVTAKLTESIHIPGGKELPRNALLIGHIDEVQPSQNNDVSKIVLTFDEARLQNGQQIAVKSTIVGVYPAGSDLVTPILNPELQMHQEPSGAHGYALTSSVMDSNSGTLSANGKNVRLGDGTELQFALAPVESGSIATGK
ncbi:MAG TPA: hypothetical protein VHT24_16000 [Pseudacidobacterium sp.]|jgi:hypothetical protein|nr:hypothetical protein [Pseudacidobacterium sp.]